MDQPTQRFGAPDGVHVVGLFGGAIVLGVVGLAAILGATATGSTTVLVVVAVGALALVLGCGAILLRRLRSAATSLERTTREASESATRLKVLVEHVPAAVYIDMADPDVSDGGRLAYMSPQIAGILGYEPDEFVSDPELWPSLIHPDDRAAALAAYDDHWQTGAPLRAEYRMLARDGSEVWLRDEAFAMADDTRSGLRVSQGLLVDTTDRKRLESQLIHDALHDPLTGLANRVLLRDHLERALGRQGREPGRVALLFVDLDDFKRVNDTFGHAVGDDILCRVAERLARAVREGDVVGRQSGDEFAILLVNVVAEEEASATAQRILGELRRPIQLGGQSIIVDGSIGIAVATRHGPGTEGRAAAKDLLIRADAAMYAAKAIGKGTFAYFDPRMPVRTWTELEAAG